MTTDIFQGIILIALIIAWLFQQKQIDTLRKLSLTTLEMLEKQIEREKYRDRDI